MEKKEVFIGYGMLKDTHAIFPASGFFSDFCEAYDYMKGYCNRDDLSDVWIEAKEVYILKERL